MCAALIRRFSLAKICYHSAQSYKLTTTTVKPSWKPQLQNIRQIRTTSSNHAIILVGPLAKKVAIVSARVIKYWWKKLPTDKKHGYKRMLKKYQQLMYVIALFGMSAGVYYLYNHIESVPITGRKRLMMLSQSHLQELGKMLYDEQVEENRENFLSANSLHYRRVKQAVTRLLNCNTDVAQVKALHWEINVIDSDQVNAFVLPDGQIFVYKGMLLTLENDDALAFLLGHEMAHAILSHGAEQMSFFNVFDLLAAITLGLVWALMPTDVVAIVAHWFHNSIASICLHRPYSRKLETEADIVGSSLATKACYDVRAATKFWETLALKDPSDAKLEWLSTHPSYQKRAELIKDRMPELQEMWRLYECHNHNKNHQC